MPLDSRCRCARGNDGEVYDHRVTLASRGVPEFREKLPCVYILASRKDGTLYTGVTSDLPGRVMSHKEGSIPGFTKRYHVDRLVFFEMHPTMSHAITREKQIKKWYRAWKIDLIERANPTWRDLSKEVIEGSAFD